MKCADIGLDTYRPVKSNQPQAADMKAWGRPYGMLQEYVRTKRH